MSADERSQRPEGAGRDGPAFVALAGVGRAFGSTVALADLTLSIAAGEFVSILGPSGSGKSTTLNLLAGFDFPTSGAIRIGGREVTFAPAYARDIGMVFQNYALFPHLSVRDNVAFPLKARRRPKAEIGAAVERALAMVQLEGLAERLPKQLSGGQQQRVALARAIVYAPKVLLMDEPLGALDRKLRADMQVEIKRLHRELGTTFLYVTHDQEEALSMSDRIAVLRQGRLEQIGTPAEVYARPATRFVAGFVGEVSFLDATVAADGATARLNHLEIALPLGRLAPLRPGQAVAVALRPEAIGLTPSRDGPARVEETLFLGNTIKCIARLHGARIIAAVPSRDNAVPRPGDAVALHLEAATAVIFPD